MRERGNSLPVGRERFFVATNLCPPEKMRYPVQSDFIVGLSRILVSAIRLRQGIKRCWHRRGEERIIISGKTADRLDKPISALQTGYREGLYRAAPIRLNRVGNSRIFLG
jgi:hypothetical protein